MGVVACLNSLMAAVMRESLRRCSALCISPKLRPPVEGGAAEHVKLGVPRFVWVSFDHPIYCVISTTFGVLEYHPTESGWSLANAGDGQGRGSV